MGRHPHFGLAIGQCGARCLALNDKVQVEDNKDEQVLDHVDDRQPPPRPVAEVIGCILPQYPAGVYNAPSRPITRLRISWRCVQVLIAWFEATTHQCVLRYTPGSGCTIYTRMMRSDRPQTGQGPRPPHKKNPHNHHAPRTCCSNSSGSGSSSSPSSGTPHRPHDQRRLAELKSWFANADVVDT